MKAEETIRKVVQKRQVNVFWTFVYNKKKIYEWELEGRGQRG